MWQEVSMVFSLLASINTFAKTTKHLAESAKVDLWLCMAAVTCSSTECMHAKMHLSVDARLVSHARLSVMTDPPC